MGLQWVTGRRLAQTIALHQLAAGELLKALLDLGRQAGRAADAGPDGRDVILGHLGMVGDGDVHGRHAGKEGGLVFVDRFEHVVQDRGDWGSGSSCRPR